MSEMTDAQRRAATRKAKILARGNAGLQRLAQTARGEEADMLYGGDDTASAASSAAPSRPDTPSVETLAKPATATASTTTASSSSKPAPASASKPAVSSNTSATADHRPGWAPSTAASGARRPAAASASTEEEQMRQQLDAMMAMLGGAGAPGGMGGGAGGPPPDMANLLASLMGGAPPPGMGGMGGMGGPGLIGDSREGTPSSNPFGGMDPMQNPFAGMPGFDGAPGQNPFDAMAGMPGMAGMFPGMGAPVQPPSKAARFFPAIHALCVLALVVFVAAWWEPALYHVFTGRENTIASWAARWSGLAGRSSAFAAKILEPVPVFYAFVTLELVLLATRVTLVRTPPSLHPLLANVLPLLPPAIGRTISTGSKYLGVVNQVYKDGCLFVFGLGMAIILAELIST